MFTELFRDYGFVEDYPQRWTLHPGAVALESNTLSTVYAPEQITFTLDYEEDSEKVSVEWADFLNFDDTGRNYLRRIFRKHLRRLHRLENINYALDDDEADPLDDIPLSEWLAIKKYYRAIRSALHHAIDSLVNEGDETGQICEAYFSSNEGSCAASLLDEQGIHYDDLKYEEDDLDYIFPTCETTQLLDFYSYTEIEELQTTYQKLWFMEREEDGDICMNLENTLQICSNYRPHYHEFFVHFPARFIEKIERVIFIGGGDSMLLHEVLKYPTLKKVVGLELDQQVTRKSFHHFKSQPHWDNDKVEWWYGDATKSLPLLPQDYWGSFDLVLVDLSETVMSFSVTQTMDVFEALSLLLKPEGIMVKNEPYIDQFSDFFDYSIHIFYGTPKICTQVLVMGSNSVDFLHHPTEDHGVERLLLEPLDDDESLRFKYMHDYRKRDARDQGKCSDDVSSESVVTEHGAVAGIIEILEAEGLGNDFDSHQVEHLIHAAARENGLHPLSIPTSPSISGTSIVILKEGYIAARPMLELNYVSFDISLWGAFNKQESLRQSLLTAVGAKSSSLYRVVLGGMYGTNTQEEDNSSIGIQVSQRRNCKRHNTSMASSESTVEKSMAARAFSESIDFLKEDRVVALVLCGDVNGECEAVKELSSTNKVVVERVSTCENIASDVRGDDEFGTLYSCEVSLIRRMMQIKEDIGYINMIVLDQTAPYEMGQILHSILAVQMNRETFLSDSHILASFIESPEMEDWKHNFVERYRREEHHFPVAKAEIFAGNSLQDMMYEVLGVNLRSFFQDVTRLEGILQESFQGFDIEARTITGGMLYFDSEYDVRVFEPAAYDKQPALEQAAGQMPVGRQSIFQFESMEEESPSMSELSEDLQKALEAIGVRQTTINRWETYSAVGEGAVLVAVFTSGSAILVWDGRAHVDINLFSTNQSQDQADQFLGAFAEESGLVPTLRDDQPRGPGRVVQYDFELE